MTKTDTEISVSNLKEETKKIIESSFGGKYKKDNKYIICLYGMSTSGKTMMTSVLMRNLLESGINSYKIAIDDFFKHGFGTIEDDTKYDFDNPASINWDNVFVFFDAILKNKKVLPIFERTRNGSEMVGEMPNPNPDVIIIEGLTAFNVISDYIFNIEEFNSYDSKKEIPKEFISNRLDLSEFKIIKIHMTMCKNKALAIRIARDAIFLNITGEAVTKRFDQHVCYAVKRWVWSKNHKDDIQLVHGSFNPMGFNILLSELLSYFGIPNPDMKLSYDRGNMINEGNAPCSGECIDKSCSHLVLDDISRI